MSLMSIQTEHATNAQNLPHIRWSGSEICFLKPSNRPRHNIPCRRQKGPIDRQPDYRSMQKVWRGKPRSHAILALYPAG